MQPRIFHVAISMLTLSQLLPAFQASKPSVLTDINRTSRAPASSYPTGLLARPDASGTSQRFQKVGQHVFFQAKTQATGAELFYCTNQAGSARLAVDLVKGAGSSNPTEFLELGGKLYFKATDGSNGYQVYEASVGTGGVTARKLTAFKNASTAGAIGTLIGVGRHLYFTAMDAVTSQYHIHRVDLGTYKSFRYSTALKWNWVGPVVLGPRIVFEGYDAQGKEAWWLDGDKIGYIRNYAGSADGRCKDPIVLGGLVYFSAFDGNWGLWRWGPKLGTKKVMGLSLKYGWSRPVVLGKRILFNGGVGEPFSVDPAVATPKIVSLPSGSKEGGMATPVILGSKLYYYGYSSKQSYAGYYLFESDGLTSRSIPGTRAYQGGVLQWIAPILIPATKPYILFGFRSGTPGDSLYRFDGTTFQRLRQIHYSLYRNSGTNSLTELGGKLIFRANDGRFGGEIWSSDGTGAGTVLHTNIAPEKITNSAYPRNFVRLGRRLYFTANDGVHGIELWSTNGKPDQEGPKNSSMVADLYAGTGSSDPKDLRACEALGKLFFTASDGKNRDVYVHDATSGKTRRVGGKAKARMFDSWTPSEGDWLVALAQIANSGLGLEPHVYDLPSNSFKLLADTNPGAGDGDLKMPIKLGWKHEFAFRSKGKLFKSKGTAATTKEVKTPGVKWIGEGIAVRGDVAFLGMDSQGRTGAYAVDPDTGKTRKFQSTASSSAQAFGSPFFAGGWLWYLATSGSKNYLHRWDGKSSSGKQVSNTPLVGLQHVDSTTEQALRVGIQYGLDDASLFFALTLGGVEMWKADTKGAARVGTQNFQSVSSAISLGGNRVACIADTSADGKEVYVIDGTKVSMVSSGLAPGRSPGAGIGSGLWAMEGHLFFSGNDRYGYGTEIFHASTGALSQSYGRTGNKDFRLRASDPVMGKNLVMKVHGDATSAAVLWSLSTPSLVPGIIQGQRYYLNLANALLLVSVMNKTDAFMTIPIPTAPRFLGMQVEGQAIVVDTKFALELTQAINLSVGK